MYNNNYFNQFRSQSVTQNFQPVKPTSALSVEEYNKLRKGKIDELEITEDDILKTKCCHRNPSTGQSDLIENNDGTVTCVTCGKRFTLISEPDQELLDTSIAYLTSVMESMKAMWVNIPPALVESYFDITPVIERIPKISKTASNNIKQYANFNGLNPTSGVPNGFNLYGNLINGRFGNPYNPQYGQQMYQQPPMQQQYPFDTQYGQQMYQQPPMQQQYPFDTQYGQQMYQQPPMQQPPVQQQTQNQNPNVSNAFGNNNPNPSGIVLPESGSGINAKLK